MLALDTRIDPTFDRRVAAIVDGVRKGGDRALFAFARRFDGVSGPIEVTRDEMIEGRHKHRLACAARSAKRCETFAGLPRARSRKRWRVTVTRGVSVEQAGRTTRAGRLLCARAAGSPAFVAADDGGPGSRRGRPRNRSRAVRALNPR